MTGQEAVNCCCVLIVGGGDVGAVFSVFSSFCGTSVTPMLYVTPLLLLFYLLLLLIPLWRPPMA